MSSVIDLFPTPVLHEKALVDEGALEEIRRAVLKTGLHENHANHALGHSINVPTLAFIAEGTESSLKKAVARLGTLMFGEAMDWQIKEVWANVLETGGEQSMHLHANSFISGVLYLTDSHPSANIVMHRPQGGGEFVFSNHNRRSSLNIYNAPRQQLGPIEAGDLVLFPSYLLHSVPVNEGGTRISLAFNAIPSALETWGYRIEFAHDPGDDPELPQPPG